MRSLLQILLVFNLGVVLSSSSWADEVKLSDVPAAVQKTIKAQAALGKVLKISQEKDDDGVTFTVVASRKEQEFSYFVAEDGTLMEVQMALEEAPAAVQKTIRAQVGKGKLDSISKSVDEGETSYDVDFTTADGKAQTLTLGADGKIQAQQIALAEAPEAVRKMIETQVGQGKLGGVYKNMDEGETFYDVDYVKGDKELDFTVGADGKLQNVQISLEETTKVARKTIHQRIGNGKLGRVDKVFREDGTFAYDIEAVKDGKPFNFSVGPKGRFLGRNE